MIGLFCVDIKWIIDKYIEGLLIIILKVKLY